MVEQWQKEHASLTDGSCWISPGVYLYTSRVMEETKHEYPDGRKDLDFTTAPYWLSFDEMHFQPVY